MASVSSANEGLTEKSKQWQRELLMERLRAHSTQHKTYQELSKTMRMCMLDKRYAIDVVEKSNLQKCLDIMQYCIKVTSRQGLVERLESLSRQLGLKFMDDTKALFISTDMFFLEIILDNSGSLIDVKVHHECKVEQQSCSELADCLNKGDFVDFTAQLEGFSSIYQLNVEPKVKTKAFDAMQAIETDLYNIFQTQSFSKDLQQVMKNSLLGIVLKRRGGHPMRLVYFVSPYDLICLESNTLRPLTLDLLQDKQIGFSVTVNLEAASANKLEILPSVTFAKDPQSGLEMPVFAPLTQMNSMLLPATYVLKLNKPLPVCYNAFKALGLLSTINASTSIDSNIPTTNNTTSNINLESSQHTIPVISKSIIGLVIQTASQQQVKNCEKGFFVNLPDQNHCYFFAENKLLEATMIQSVPFTEPSQVPKILDFLKKQALFYSLLSSCIRPQTKMNYDVDSVITLEVNVVSFTQISVSLQHPYEECMVSVEFELHKGNIECNLYSVNNNCDLLSLKLTNIVQKCCSIPITIRSLFKFWDQERIYQHTSARSVCLGTGAGPSTGDKNTGNIDCSRSVFGNYNIGRMSNDLESTVARAGGVSGGIMKMDRINLSLKYKPEINNEDFYESPKSHENMKIEKAPMGISVSASMINRDVHSSLGPNHQNEEQQKMASMCLPSDRYNSIFKDKIPSIRSSASVKPFIGQTDRCNLNVLDKSNDKFQIVPFIAETNESFNKDSDTLRDTSTTINPVNNNILNSTLGNNNLFSGCSNNSSSTTVEMASVTGNSFLSGSDIKDKKCLNKNNSIGNSFLVNRPSDYEKKEKKRKKMCDDSHMGPPEKMHSRQNSPALVINDVPTNVISRKFPSPSSSPKPSNGNALLSSSIPGSSLPTRPSPKHSPVYSNSPKHSSTSNSPKSPFSLQSPKLGSSGKPSMSTLKNATSPKNNDVLGVPILNTTAMVRSLTAPGSNSSNPTSNTVAAAAAAATLAVLKAKEKSSSITQTPVVSSAAVAAAAAVKSSMNVTSTIQQLKNINCGNNLTTVAPIADVSSFGRNVSSVANPNTMDINGTIRSNVSKTFGDVSQLYANHEFNSCTGIRNSTSSGNITGSQPANNITSSLWPQ